MIDRGSLIEKLRPRQIRGNSRLVAVLGNLLGQSWSEPPIISLDVIGGHVMADGESICHSKDFGLVLDSLCREAQLTQAETGFLFKLINDRQLLGNPC